MAIGRTSHARSGGGTLLVERSEYIEGGGLWYLDSDVRFLAEECRFAFAGDVRPAGDHRQQGGFRTREHDLSASRAGERSKGIEWSAFAFDGPDEECLEIEGEVGSRYFASTHDDRFGRDAEIVRWCRSVDGALVESIDGGRFACGDVTYQSEEPSRYSLDLERLASIVLEGRTTNPLAARPMAVPRLFLSGSRDAQRSFREGC